MASTAVKPGPRPRHVPQRTCVACRSVEAKRGMVRIVRTPEGRIEIDATGKRNGRGAYVHDSRMCWEDALKKGRLDRALKTDPSSEDIAGLRSHVERLPADEETT